MLHFVTDAPLYIVYGVMSLARGWVEDANVTDPSWVEAHVHVSDIDAGNVLHALKEWRVQAFALPRAAVSDPTFALAAVNIDREGGPHGAPAASRVSEDDPRTQPIYPQVVGY